MKKLKRANEYFSIPADEYQKTGAFNPVIGIDSLFFIDPVLLTKTSIPELKDSLKLVRKYFSQVITLLKTKNVKTLRIAHKKLVFPEVRGIGIGFGSSTDDGSAIGPKLASDLIETAKELIDMGITDPAIFEVMGLFQEDFGPDRLSDALINILLPNLYNYTERVAKELKIKDLKSIQTYERTYMLPKHPLQEKALIFLPQDILRDLPVAMSYEDLFRVAIFNEELRKKFNELIAPCFADNNKPSKSEVKEYLFDDKNKVLTLIEVYERANPSSYNFEKDPQGLYLWLEKAKKLVSENPITIPEHPKEDELDGIVKKIIASFKRFIEIKGGWRSLYGDNRRPLNESHARHFFYAVAIIYCELCDIDITPESNAGRGPVDFKLSRGHLNKIVVEIKLTSGNVRQGYQKQTRIYQESESADKSYYVVLQITQKSSALEDIIKLESEETERGDKHPSIVVIDARERPSASKA